MRLRPSGRAGPVASQVESFAEYRDREAWTWEHMALTRARVISASPSFRTKIETVIRQVLTRPRDASAVANDVADMRRAIALEKGENEIWDLKYAAGGVVDIDFIAQYLHNSFTQPRNPKFSMSAPCMCSTRRAARRVAAICGENPAFGGAPLPRSDANPQALRQRTFQSGDRRGGPFAYHGPRRRCARLFIAAGAGEGNASRGAAGVSGD